MITNMEELLDGTIERINTIKEDDVSNLSTDDRELACFILTQKLRHAHEWYDVCNTTNTENIIELHDTVMHLLSMISVYKHE